MEKKHKWSEDGSVYHCSDGDHNSWWKSLTHTDEWKRWHLYAGRNMLYDVDECAECGWMSYEHAQDFMKFVRSLAFEDFDKIIPPKSTKHWLDKEGRMWDVGFNKCISIIRSGLKRMKSPTT